MGQKGDVKGADLNKIDLTPSHQSLHDAVFGDAVPKPGALRPPKNVFKDRQSVINYLDLNRTSFFDKLQGLIRSSRIDDSGAVNVLAFFRRQPSASEVLEPASRFKDSIAKVKGWLTPEAIGNPALSTMLEQYPPLYLVFSSQISGAFGPNGIGGYLGLQFFDANLIFLNAHMAGEHEEVVALHETLHYLTYMSYQNKISLDWKEAKPIQVPVLEGLTQYMTMKLLADNKSPFADRNWGNHPYGYETKAISMLAGVVGDDALKEAFFSGDFSEVRRIFNEKGGDFDSFFWGGRFVQSPVFKFSDCMELTTLLDKQVKLTRP